MDYALKYNGLLCKKKVWEEARRAIMIRSQGVDDEDINELINTIGELINAYDEEIQEMKNGKFEVSL